MQVCYDYPPPSVVSAVRGPHQANFSKASSPVSWHPRTFQINPRNQPPNTNSKQRQPTPPRYCNPSDTSYPFATPWNNWNMYQMSSHNMYANYNYSPGVVSSISFFIYIKSLFCILFTIIIFKTFFQKKSRIFVIYSYWIICRKF